MTHSAEKILELATVDPERTLALGQAFLDRTSDAGSERAVVYRAMSVASRVLRQLDEAVNLAERAREVAVAEGDKEQQLLAIVTMVGPMVVLGRAEEAVKLIEGAGPLATTPFLEARLTYQRGVVLQMQGQPGPSAAAFEAALPAFREAGDQGMVKSALQGLGLQRLFLGELGAAERALDEALALAVARGEKPAISGIEHTLGLVAAYRGDLTRALSLLIDSDQIYMRLTGSAAPQHVARCEVLVSAGLFREACQLASDIAEHHRASGDPEHLADALLVAARAALLGGDFEEAGARASEAADVFEDRQRPGLVVEARRIAMEAKYRLEGASDRLMRDAMDVGSVLEASRQVVAAAEARLLVGRIALDLGAVDVSLKSLEPLAHVDTGPVELRIQGRLARARMRGLRGDSRGADAAARSGIRLIDDYQAALGATDLRMGLEQHGAELGSIGLGLAFQSRNPRRILGWMERTRARALRHEPVIPDEDDAIREALARLRQVEAEMRHASNAADPGLQRERRRLQEEVRTSDRLKKARSMSSAGFAIGGLVDQVGDRVLLEMAVHDGHTRGVLVHGGRVRRIDLGPAGPLFDELRHVRFGMRRAARLGRPVDRESLLRLEEMLLGRVPFDDEVVLVPPPSLMTVPWAAFPRLHHRVVTVSPSAEMWWRANRRDASETSVVVAGGPDLAVAEAEVAAIASLYPKSARAVPGATVDEVRSVLDGVGVAHIACHATFQVENPMFSALRLGDGDLNVYDIERLRRPPSLVVLSACDSGYTEARSGDELAGLTSALLSIGTRSVVASVGLVPDSEATSALMVRFHRGLLDGLEPAAALAKARAGSSDEPADFIAAASFVCVGG